MRRWPESPGLPNSRKPVPGSASAASRPPKRTSADSPSTTIAHDAAGPSCSMAGTGRPSTARTCSANSERSCETSVTIPVSCGRGETSLKYTSPPLMNSSTPKIPAPPSAPVTTSATRLASPSSSSVIGCGCHDSR